jgi:hypothetical protein
MAWKIAIFIINEYFLFWIYAYFPFYCHVTDTFPLYGPATANHRVRTTEYWHKLWFFSRGWAPLQNNPSVNSSLFLNCTDKAIKPSAWSIKSQDFLSVWDDWLTDWPTDRPTLWGWDLLEKTPAAQLLKNFPTF